MKTLHLNIYLRQNNRACMVFKRDGFLYRIGNLLNALQFVAEMEWLSRTIARGEQPNFLYDLWDNHNKQWVLECSVLNGIVALNLWLRCKSPNEHLSARFCWDGEATAFRRAVRNMSLMVDMTTRLRLLRMK